MYLIVYVIGVLHFALLTVLHTYLTIWRHLQQVDHKVSQWTRIIHDTKQP